MGDNLINYEREYKCLYETAFLFERLQAWELFEANELIAIKDRHSDSKLYCSIQKDEQQLLLISVYTDETIKTYHQYLTREAYTIAQPQYFKHLNARNTIAITFKDKKQLSEPQRELINKLGYRFKHKNTWPIFMKLESYKVPVIVSEKHDLETLDVVLDCLTHIYKERLNHNCHYSYESDDEIMYYNYSDEQRWQPTKCHNRLKQPMHEPVIYQNDIMIHKVRRSPVKPLILEVIHFLLTEPMQEDDKTPIYPLVFGVVEQQYGEVIFADLVNEEKDYQQVILNEIAKLLAEELKCRPIKIIIHDDELIELFEHFCKKTDIELVKGEVKIAQKFMEHVLTQTIEKDDSYSVTDEQIDLILDSTSQICEVITNSSCFCKNLSEKDKEQFKYTIELLHIMMISQFQELPDCWSPENFDYVMNKMFPKVFPKERLPIVTEMVREYITVTGEANVMPNYKYFLGKLNHHLSLI